MGGPVKIAVRDHDSKLYANELYTSSISAFFDNDKFYRLDPLHLREYMFDLANDDRLFAPSGYGLVVGDHVNKKIYSMQGYTSLSQISKVSLSLSLTGGIAIDPSGVNDYLDHERFKRLFDQGYIKYGITPKLISGVFKHSYDDISKRTWKDIFTEILDEKERRTTYTPSHTAFMIGGYEIVNYAETVTGTIRYRDDLLKAGFALSSEDLAEWDEWIDERKRWADEEDSDHGEHDNPYEINTMYEMFRNIK